MDKQPHRHRGRFYNNQTDSIYVRIKHMLKAFWIISKHRSHRPNKKKLLSDAAAITPQWLVRQAFAAQSKELVITWLGHATFLIQVDGFNILTDPVFYEISSLTKRFFKPLVLPEHLPAIDVVVLSHNHRDHMDKASLLALKHFNPRMYVPVGDRKWFVRRGFSQVQELTWGDVCTVSKDGQTLELTFLPAAHWTGRNLLDTNKSLWGSWLMRAQGKNIYFAGDTAYADHFADIGNKFGPIFAALMPIGPYEPRELMDESHLDSQQAIQAFIELNAQHFIPMHWGTFMFGTDSFAGPIEDLQVLWQKNAEKLAGRSLHVVKYGQQRSLTESD